MMFMADSPELVVTYLAAMRTGAVPVPVSTMLRADDLAFLLRDSRARALAFSPQFSEIVAKATGDGTELGALLVPGQPPDLSVRAHDLTELSSERGSDRVYSTGPDSPAFWLYTSGTTGEPKGAMHRHGAIPAVCETYAAQVLGIGREDRSLSAAKAFFAYGLGNSVLFPMSVGAASILEPSPSRPDVIAARAREYGATLFFAGPTFFANMLKAGLPADALAGVRLAASAGEALPASLYERWTKRFSVDILDGIGMTEMLHIFLSNREGDVRPGTTGVAVPGYELRIVDPDGRDVDEGAPGTLLVKGQSTAIGYWSRFEATRQVFEGEWLRTGDTYVREADGSFRCLGRANDMLKASGIWVSPSEVEGCVAAHPDVAEAVVVGGIDPDGLEKPVAFVVLRDGATVTEEELIEHCRSELPSFKVPRQVRFVSEYPTTATGKIRRVDLRGVASELLVQPSKAPA